MREERVKVRVEMVDVSERREGGGECEERVEVRVERMEVRGEGGGERGR